MKCFNCKKEITDESKSIHLCDGDFVCDENCKKEYREKRYEFFNNIGNDEWYKNYMGGC